MTAEKKFTDAELKKLKKVFTVFDKDKNGKISVKEVATILRAQGHLLTDKEAKDMVMEADRNKNGVLEFPEFCNFMQGHLPKKDPQEELKVAFSKFDKDKSGFISKKELQTVLTSLGDKLTDAEVSEIFNAVDTNNDGKVGYAEFIEMMCGDPKKTKKTKKH